MKLIGIDYGRRRIGLATTDETGEFIRSLPTLDRKKQPRHIDILSDIVGKERVSGVVIGLPLDADGGETEMSLEIRAFAAKLSGKTTVPVHFVDESLTSKRAHDIILYRKRKSRRDKGAVDGIAACLIIEEFKKETR
jgi:putative holliday junction resolvase